MKFTDYNIIVLKLGSALVVDSKNNNFRVKWLQDLACDIEKLRNLGIKVLIVCSGAIASASRKLGKNKQELSLDELQAYAAYGQALLIGEMQKIFAKQQIELAQILITNDDCQNRRRYLNMRATISKLLEMDIVPIINENDTISTEEIKFGDNDVLAARVVALSEADLLILLSDIEGLYDSNPKENKGAKLIKEIKQIDHKILALASSKTNIYGTGGVKSKIQAAKIANGFGADMIITKGAGKNPLLALEQQKLYSIFSAKNLKLSSRKKWLSGLKIKGEVVVNKGAEETLSKGGASLLPVGVSEVKGEFFRGDMILIINSSGNKIAQGLSSLDSAEIEIYKGKNSKEISELTNNLTRLYLVHYDDMLLT